jgi:hypothetical protein
MSYERILAAYKQNIVGRKICTLSKTTTGSNPYYFASFGETTAAGKLLSAALTALFTNNSETVRVTCCVSAIKLYMTKYSW